LFNKPTPIKPVEFEQDIYQRRRYIFTWDGHIVSHESHGTGGFGFLAFRCSLWYLLPAKWGDSAVWVKGRAGCRLAPSLHPWLFSLFALVFIAS
jgi:hypothetical protein